MELQSPVAEVSPENPNIIRHGAIEYSASTVIVNVDASATDAQITALAKKYSLEIVYNMKNLHIVVLRTAEPQTPAALDELISALKAEAIVLNVEKDHIIRLDDPVEKRRPHFEER